MKVINMNRVSSLTLYRNHAGLVWVKLWNRIDDPLNRVSVFWTEIEITDNLQHKVKIRQCTLSALKLIASIVIKAISKSLTMYLTISRRPFSKGVSCVRPLFKIVTISSRIILFFRLYFFVRSRIYYLRLKYKTSLLLITLTTGLTFAADKRTDSLTTRFIFSLFLLML